MSICVWRLQALHQPELQTAHTVLAIKVHCKLRLR